MTISCKYHQDLVKKSLLRFQEPRSFLEECQPLSMKVILVSLCLGLNQEEKKHGDRTWNYFIVPS
ncbi:hypothetical protein V4Y02_23725, partial [Escherichia coli]